MPSKKLPVVEQRILAHIEQQHCGSGDIEVEDAVGPCEYLQTRFGDKPEEFAQILHILQGRLQSLDGTWLGRGPEPAESMPCSPEPGQVLAMWLYVAHLGFMEDSCIKGKSKCIRILECIEDFLAEPFASERAPLQVLAPWGPWKPEIQIFSMRLRIGFARSLSCQLILLAVMDLKLQDAELLGIQHLLQPLFVVKAVWEGSANIREEVDKTIRGKMQLAEVKRLDPIQCAHAWATRARAEGVEYNMVIDTYLQEFRDAATGTQSISDLEEKVIKLIPAQTAACQRKLAYHWQNFKVAESGVPLASVTNDAWIYGTKQGHNASALWEKILMVSEEKRQFCVQRRIGIFLKNVKDAQRLRKKINIKTMAGSLRDKMSHEVAYEIAALFCHFASEFQRVLSAAKWEECLQRFFRGQFDAELSEKVSHKDPNLVITSFRFLSLFGAKLLSNPVPSTAQASQEEAESLLLKELSDLAWVKKKLQSEVSAWTDYKKQVQQWQCSTELHKNAKITEIDRTNGILITKELARPPLPLHRAIE